DVNKLNRIGDLIKYKDNAKASTKILLSIRNYNVEQWPQPQDDKDKDDNGNVEYNRIITETITTIKDHQLDGIDIEYPGMRGSLCKGPNPGPNPNEFIWDKNNDDKIINFLKNIRVALNGMEGVKTLMLTVGRDVIGNLNGAIDYLNIETYHNSLYQNSKEPNNGNYKSHPNSPLDVYKKAYEDWNNLGGIDSKKIIMGVDFGNTIQMVPNENIRQFQTVEFPKSADLFDFNKLKLIDQIQPIREFCSGADSNLYLWLWRDLSKSVLDPSGGFCSIKSNLNWTRKFVETDTSVTPWLYSVVDTKVAPNFYYYVSYEDFVSLHSKLEFAMTNSIGGMSISDVSYDDINNSLLNFMQPIRGKAVPTTGGSSPSNEGNGKSAPKVSDNVGKIKKGIITGSIVGSILGLFLLAICAYWYRQKTLRKSEASDINTESSSNRVVSSTIIPNDRRFIDHLTIE
ncbi:4873_t:CDS:2, partial [Funneliformis geosporum]